MVLFRLESVYAFYLEMRLPLSEVNQSLITYCSRELTFSYTAIEAETESLQWAAAGSNVTLYLTAVDPVHLNIGSVLCPISDVIPVATAFIARIIVFDIQVPITAGASVRVCITLVV